MAGGWSQKHGTRYESWWAAYQLCLLVQGSRSWVQFDHPTIEDGMDVSLQDRQEVVQGHQCKTRNQKRNWSLNDLEQLGCITYLQQFLKQSPSHEYCFISTQLPTELKKLVSIAESLATLDQFKESLLADNALAQTWTQWCRALDPQETPGDTEIVAFDYLKRFDFVLFDDTGKGREFVSNLACELFTGDENTTCLLLIEFINDHIGQRIYQDTIKAYLDQKGVVIKGSGFTPRMGQSIQLLKDEYDASIKPHLIESQLIVRPEVEKLFHDLSCNSSARIHCVHGRAGYGKSSILFAITQKLEEAQIPYLAMAQDCWTQFAIDRL